MKARSMPLRLGDLVDTALTAREQARVLAQMRRTLQAELRKLDAQKQQRARTARVRHREKQAAIASGNVDRIGQPGTGTGTGKAAYWAVTGAPPDCAAGDCDSALAFYRRVQRAIEQGGWTHSERSALYDLERKWRGRAYGTDPRFMLLGTKPGRLPRAQAKLVARLRDEHDRRGG